MIRLQNVTTQKLIGLYGDKKSPRICKRNAKIIKKLELTDYRKLKDYYGLQEILSTIGCNEMCFDDDLRKVISETEEELEITNLSRREPKIFDVDDAIVYNGQIIMLDQVDKSVTPLSLLFGSPFEYGSYKDSYDMIGYYPRRHLLIGPDISTLKHLISHCTVHGRNAYTYYCPQAGEITIEVILRALKLYQEQVIRQIDSFDGELTDENLSKIFHLNKEEKMELIEKQYEDVVDYLCQQNDYIWGSGSIKQFSSGFGKKEYTEQDVMYRSAHGKSKRDLSNKFCMKHLLSEYVTLEEARNGLLEEGPTKKKVIDRFVIK